MQFLKLNFEKYAGSREKVREWPEKKLEVWRSDRMPAGQVSWQLFCVQSGSDDSAELQLPGQLLCPGRMGPNTSWQVYLVWREWPLQKLAVVLGPGRMTGPSAHTGSYQVQRAPTPRPPNLETALGPDNMFSAKLRHPERKPLSQVYSDTVSIGNDTPPAQPGNYIPVLERWSQHNNISKLLIPERVKLTSFATFANYTGSRENGLSTTWKLLCLGRMSPDRSWKV